MTTPNCRIQGIHLADHLIMVKTSKPNMTQIKSINTCNLNGIHWLYSEESIFI